MGSTLIGTQFSGGSYSYVCFSECDLSRMKFDGARLDHADLSRCDLCEADLRGCDLSQAVVSAAKLDKADLRGATLSGCDMLSWIRFSPFCHRGVVFSSHPQLSSS